MSQSNSSTEYFPMMQDVTIMNFKGIKNCEIKDLGKVNLFIGRNDCGKSSIMEAIYFTGKEFTGMNLPESIRRRANRGSSISARELWYGYRLNSEVSVKLEFNEKDFTQMNIKFDTANKRVEVYVKSGSPQGSVSLELGNQYHGIGFGGFRSHARSIYSPHNKQIKQYFSDSVYVDPNIKTNLSEIEGKYLNEIELSEEKSSDLSKRTSKIYDTEPRWQFIPHPDFASNQPSRFAILERKRRVFFDNFGDGFHYGLAILAIAKTRNNTALFVEEIESHQHPEAIKNLVSNLLEIAQTNNLQLFITIHNPYVRRYLYYYYKSPEERKKDFRCFHVIRDKNSGKVEAINKEGITDITEDLHGKP